LQSVYGRPYEILRLKTDRYDQDRLAAYTNAIIVNGTIYVPLFQIPADSVALRTWQDAMPGYAVKGFTFALHDEPLVNPQLVAHYTTGYGWTDGDALHCRTRAIWDEDMLFISVKKVAKEVDHRDRNTVYATIIDYGNKCLAAGRSRICWRISGAPDWYVAPLTATDDPTHFHYIFPALEKGTIIEYYIAAESLSGRKETRPRTAPAGTYRFRVK
jgi:agmatine deiminase